MRPIRPTRVRGAASIRILLSGLALGVVVACGGEAPSPGTKPGAAPAGSTAGQHPDTLEALVAAVQRARATGKGEDAKALVASMVPTKADLAALLTPGPAADAFVAAWKFVDLPPQTPAVAELGAALFDPRDPARTETRVHAATTEEIVAYAKGSVAWKDFPGGMRRFAALAAPGRTWYVVEHVEPGKDTGMKYTCFTRVGARWIFLPKPWSALPREDE